MNAPQILMDIPVLENRTETQFSTTHVIRLMEPDAISFQDVLGEDDGHAFIHMVLEHSMEAVVCANESGAIVHFNSMAERVFGYKAADVLGLTLPKLIPAPVLDEALMSGLPSLDFEKVQGVRRNGTPLPMRIKMARVGVSARKIWVIYIRDMQEIQTKQLEIERLAHIDSLTGLPNRNLLQDRMSLTLATARRYHRNFALLYIDLDKFKAVNDTHGHALGDGVLREIAKRLKACVRDTDTVARIGGDEFVALLTDLKHENDVRIVADRILKMCRQPVALGNLTFQLGASVGIAVYPSDGDSLEVIQRHADTAMYHAKQNGRDQFAFYTQELNSVAERKTVIERGLHRALNSTGLLLHYQPQIDLNTGELIGAEALMRWNDSGTLMQPGEFIPVAEESGLIVPMGEWALREACKTAEQWRRMGLGAGLGIRVGVNLSVRQFTEALPDLVFSILDETGLPPQLLDLEITESFLANDRKAFDILHRLQVAGVHLSVDDFGTGYSCLAYLKDLPLDTIKIDRSFVNGIDATTRASNRTIVKAIVTMAEALGHSILAEGVETESQAEVLREMGVSMCQGYHYSRPLPTADFEMFARGRD